MSGEGFTVDVELISRAVLLRMLDENGVVFRSEIEKIPAVDAVPVVHARWIDYKDDHQCSACKEHTIFDAYAWKAIQFEFCPHCGAKMDGERREQ